jgi:ankyrin repeat protein
MTKKETVFTDAGRGAVAKVKRYLDNGGDPNACNDQGVPLLSLAAHFGHGDVISELLRRGANPDVPDRRGFRAIHHAASTGMDHVLDVLIEGGARTDILTDGGESVLMVAACGGRPDTTRMLLGRGLDAKFQDRDGFTPLMYAVYNLRCGGEIARLLLDAGADPTAVTTKGMTARSFAEERKNVGVLTALDLAAEERNSGQR